jgi:hypothetical protein
MAGGDKRHIFKYAGEECRKIFVFVIYHSCSKIIMVEKNCTRNCEVEYERAGYF